MVGDHIAAFWFEDGKHEWCLGIIDTVVSDSIIKVSYLIRLDRNKFWAFPEEAGIRETSVDQIICKNIDDNLIPV